MLIFNCKHRRPKYNSMYKCVLKIPTPEFPTQFITMEPTRCNNFQNFIFGMKLHMFRIFYNHGSVNRDSILTRCNEMQQYTGVYLLQNYSTGFGRLSHPSSGVHQTVTAASGTVHITCRSNNLPPAWPN